MSLCTKYQSQHCKYEAATNDEYLTGYYLDDERTREVESIPVIIWTDGGKDVHCTTNVDINTWEKNHS